MKMDRRMMLGGAVGLGLGVAAIGALTWRALDRTAGVGADLLSDPDNPILGNPEGDVTIVEWFDYQCGYCKQVHPALMEVVETDGNIRLLMKDWPIFGGASVMASQLVLGSHAAGHYGRAHAALMGSKGSLGQTSIRRALDNAGVDTDAAWHSYRADRDRWDGLLSRNAAQAAELGLGGTPGFIIGRALYPGAIGADVIRHAVAEARRMA